MVLVSIIMGLGITTLLSGAISALRADTPTKPGLIHSIWVTNLLVSHIGVWLLRRQAAGRVEWGGLEVAAFMVTPIILFAMAKLVFPPEGREADLNAYFIDNRKPFFGLFAVLGLATAIGQFLFLGAGEGALDVVTPFYAVVYSLVFVALSLLLGWSSNKRLHLFFALLSLVFVLLMLATPAYRLTGA